jgi:hypothetical protein
MTMPSNPASRIIRLCAALGRIPASWSNWSGSITARSRGLATFIADPHAHRGNPQAITAPADA